MLAKMSVYSGSYISPGYQLFCISYWEAYTSNYFLHCCFFCLEWCFGSILVLRRYLHLHCVADWVQFQSDLLVMGKEFLAYCLSSLQKVSEQKWFKIRSFPQNLEEKHIFTDVCAVSREFFNLMRDFLEEYSNFSQIFIAPLEDNSSRIQTYGLKNIERTISFGDTSEVGTV